MALNTFISGVNTTFSTELNENFEFNKYKHFVSVSNLTGSSIGSTTETVIWSTVIPANTFSSVAMMNFYGKVLVGFPGTATMRLYINDVEVRNASSVQSVYADKEPSVDWHIIRDNSLIATSTATSVRVTGVSSTIYGGTSYLYEVSIYGW